MKKILLIIAFTLCIFQIVVLATVIDIGTAAINRGNTFIDTYTIIVKGNPANGTGTITTIEIWCDVDLVLCEVATFYNVSGSNFSTRDTEYIGDVQADAYRTFAVDLNVQEGDYIGIYYQNGNIELDTTGGEGVWYEHYDKIPCTNVTFTNFQAAYIISLCGTGMTTEEDNAIFFGINF